MRPYGLKWIEDYISAEDLIGYETVRRHTSGQGLASGEHWYMLAPFAHAAGRRLVDIFQPDVLWCGGITAAVKICHLAEANGISVITHAGMNYPFGQHLAMAMPAITWGERSEGVSAPGVPLEEMVKIPGTAVIKNGTVRPSDAPGFGMEIDRGVDRQRVGVDSFFGYGAPAPAANPPSAFEMVVNTSSRSVIPCLWARYPGSL